MIRDRIIKDVLRITIMIMLVIVYVVDMIMLPFADPMDIFYSNLIAWGAFIIDWLIVLFIDWLFEVI